MKKKVSISTASESSGKRAAKASERVGRKSAAAAKASGSLPKFSDDTPAQKFTYNFLGQVVSVQDASGARSISYDHYGQTNEDVQPIAGASYTLQEHWDAYGRSTGYALLKDGASQCDASTTYGALGRIQAAGFTHEGTVHQFRYGYLAGSNLLQSLVMPNGVTLTQSYEEKRDLLTGMDYVRDNSLVTQREYNYDALGRPTTRDTRYPNKAIHHADAFTYNKRSESARRLAGRLDKSAAFAPKGRSIDGAMLSQLTGALLDGNAYTYAYDNIGNREIAQEAAEDITYDANDLNQYTRISTNGEDFTPEYDADGNQTLVQTSTGIWHVTYNGQNRAIKFESEDGHTVITCDYDYMGRRFEKKVTVDGTTTLHERYIYRGYLQIAALDMLHDASLIHSIIWDPTQEVATRPLAIRENGVWYTYGWDLTKNICELYGQEGFIRTIYTYSPYGQVTAEEDVTQPIQWSSEVYDAELGLVYYNYRYYNLLDGRWTRKDLIRVAGRENAYCCLNNSPVKYIDRRGLDVWIENTDQILGLHQRICVDTWVQDNSLQSEGSNGACCMNGKRWKKSDKYCISFGTQVECLPYFSSGDGGSSDSDSSGPDASSSANEQHTPNTGQSHFPEGIEGPTPNSNGVVYIDIIDPTTGESGRIKTSCQQDITSKEYLEGLVGQEAEYSLLGQTCRDFSWAVHEYLEKILKQGK